jgi:hypothetical protein
MPGQQIDHDRIAGAHPAGSERAPGPHDGASDRPGGSRPARNDREQGRDQPGRTPGEALEPDMPDALKDRPKGPAQP